MPLDKVGIITDDSPAVLVVENGDPAGTPSASITAKHTPLNMAPDLMDKRKQHDSSKHPRPIPNSGIGTDAPAKEPNASDSANGPASTLSKELRRLPPERPVQPEEERVLDKSNPHRSDSGGRSSSRSEAPPLTTSSSMLAPGTLHMSLHQAQAASPSGITKPKMPGLEDVAKPTTEKMASMCVSDSVYTARRNQIQEEANNGRLSLNWGSSFAPDVDSIALVLGSEISSYSFRDLFPRSPVLISFGFSFQGESKRDKF